MLIGGTPGYRCAGAFRSMEEALAQITDETVRVILVDIGLPGMSGIEGIPLLRARFPEAAVLVLSVYEDDERIFATLCAGACGYLLKKTPLRRDCWRVCGRRWRVARPCLPKWRARSLRSFAKFALCRTRITI